MTGWIKTSLGELCDITMGQSPPSNTYNTQKNGLPFFQGKAEFTDLYPVPQQWCSNPQKKADEGNILISVRAPVGDVNIADQHCCIGRGLAAIKYDNCPRFIFYFLMHSKGELEKVSTGTTFKAISKQNILNYSLFIPSLKEQHQIVSKIEELFSELDNGIESLKKAREQLKTYRQAVLKHAFEGKLTQEWREQQIEAGNPPEPVEKILERIQKEREAHYQKQVEEWKKACKQAQRCGSKKPAKPRKPKDLPPLTKKELDELPELPEGWGWSYLDYCGYWIGGGTPSKQRKEYWLDGDVLWVSPKDMKNQYIKITIDKITKTAVKESSAKLIPSGSVLFVVRSGILRRTLPVSITTEISTVNQDLQAFTPFKVFPEYIYWYCVANEFHIRNNCAKSGTTVESIETTQLKKYRISVCSPEEQQAIVSEIETRLSVCDQLEQTIEDSLKKAEALRQSILKKAFEGELTREWRLAHPELISGENSAESLLARIRAEKAQLKWIKR